MKSSDNMRMALVHAEFGMQLALMIASELMGEMKIYGPISSSGCPISRNTSQLAS